MKPRTVAPESALADGATVHVWRHPRAEGAEGRCIGRTDLAVDPRKAKRLAHRIRTFARRHGLSREVVTSPLRRCADVGRVLAAWGWQHRIDPALIEVDFGSWDGRAWIDIPRAEIDEWCADLLHRRPGHGESVQQLLERVQAWRRRGSSCPVIGHGGWISAALWLTSEPSVAPRTAINPADWPSAPAHSSRTAITASFDPHARQLTPLCHPEADRPSNVAGQPPAACHCCGANGGPPSR